MIKADVTAENKAAYSPQIHEIEVEVEEILTKIKVLFKSSPYFLLKSPSCSSAARLNFS